MKQIAVIAADDDSVHFYAKQVQYFFGEYADITCYNANDVSAHTIVPADLYLVSTCAFMEYDNVRSGLPFTGEIVVTRVTMTKESLSRLRAIPRGTKALVVNINPQMSTETTALFNQFGVNNIEFFPHSPGQLPVSGVDLAITPGEAHLVPENIKNIVDIGPRVLSGDTIREIALKMHFDYLLETKRFKEYAAGLVEDNYSINHIFTRSMRMESLFEILQNAMDVGIIVVDGDGTIINMNKKAQDVTGLSGKKAIGGPASEILPNIPFAPCCQSRQEIREKLVKIHNVDLSITVTPVLRRNELVGALATVQRFTEEEYKQHRLRVQLMNKGHVAKYTFDDILGDSPAIHHACDIARKMAHGSAPVLITGESGTGKELFAHAIHSASQRCEYPFVAINCAAIPDSLLESELFGYEEGAFTGAKKGGKIGFFEFAHKGTLFLDEIEGMSQLLQLKLLRVLQEKEVLRIGGERIISIDVRIIAATNQDLMAMVRKGDFRKDLYYRLAVLPIELPPLRQRGNDVLLLIEKMKEKIGASFTLTDQAQKVLLKQPWDGNIRQLRNCVEYMAYLEKERIAPEDLPIGIDYVDHADVSGAVPCAVTGSDESGDSLEAFLLHELALAAKQGESRGRKSLSSAAMANGFFITEQEMRGKLAGLEEKGLISVARGRGGSRITAAGLYYLDKMD